MSDQVKRQAIRKTLRNFALTKSLFVLGTFESGVTIYSQQVRALNLAWAMTNLLTVKQLANVAVIGGGFAGVTLAAALAKKGVPLVTVFEKRPVLFPLQEGSDTRWVHPHIYNWPSPQSEQPSASLPIMNWNAGRASDVVAQASSAWLQLRQEFKKRPSAKSVVQEIYNVKYIQIGNGQTITWVSPESDVKGGETRAFSCIVLAMGFGEEPLTPGSTSYWRNESLGQPELSPGKRTFLISGYGDGALVDLFRIRLVQYRQDRILDELFSDTPNLVNGLKQTYGRLADPTSVPIPEILAALQAQHVNEYRKLLTNLSSRLRKDTTAILHVNQGPFSRVFSHKSSFQNKLLLGLLFSAGAFTPSHREIRELIDEYRIPPENVLRRHGTDRVSHIRSVFSPSMLDSLTGAFRRFVNRSVQSDTINWPGGYWAQLDRKFHKITTDSEKQFWRQEYLPTTTELISTVFCSGIKALIAERAGQADFRLTLHRVIVVGHQCWLQQTCKYFGNTNRLGEKGRTFSVDEGIIGLAYRNRTICRTRVGKRALKEGAIIRDAALLKVGTDAQAMKPKVMSLLAIPMIAGNRVCSILFADSSKPQLFEDTLLSQILALASAFLGLVTQELEIQRIKNYNFGDPTVRFDSRRPRLLLEAVEVLPASRFPPPRSEQPFYLNYEQLNA